VSAVVRRALLLALTGVSLYLLAPSLIEVFSSAPQLTKIKPAWFVPMVLLEAGSLVAMALVQRVCLQTRRVPAILASGLAGNALAKVVPGGGAAGSALQYAMLTSASPLTAAQVVSALTAANLLTFATLLALPILTLPPIVLGLPVAKGLVQATLVGVVAFAVMSGVGALLLASDGALVTVGRAIQSVRNRVLRRRTPLQTLPERLLAERDTILRAVGARWREALAASIARWLLDYGVLVTALAAVGAHPRPSLVLLAYVGAQVLSQIPITPGGLGFVEAGLTGTLALAGVAAGDAVRATFAYRLFSYWLPLPFGLLGLLLHRRRPAPAISG
jgi:uncharacterized protein (TIRG00374 family)